MRSRGKSFGLVPYDFRSPSLARARQTFWNARDQRFLVPVFFGIGWTVNLKSVSRHPLRALLLTALIVWRLRVTRNSRGER